MNVLRALIYGFRGGRGALLSAAVLYAAALAVSSLAMLPLGRGAHALLDRVPAAKDLQDGQGLDLILEGVQESEPLTLAAFSGLRPAALLFPLVALYLLGGAYSVSAGHDRPFLKAFFGGATFNFLPFAGIVLLNLGYLLVLAGIGAAAIGGLMGIFGESPDARTGIRVLIANLALAAFLANLWRQSAGYGRAWNLLAGGRDGVRRSFFRGLVFTWRRFIPVNVLTWAVNAMRGLLFLAWLLATPGYSSGGRWLASALLAQTLFFALAYLRVVEVRTQVSYLQANLLARDKEAAEYAGEPIGGHEDSEGVPESLPVESAVDPRPGQ